MPKNDGVRILSILNLLCDHKWLYNMYLVYVSSLLLGYGHRQ